MVLDDNNREVGQEPFYSIHSVLIDEFGLDIHPNSFEERGLKAWDEINTKKYKVFKVESETNDFGEIIVPCNADRIIGVFKSSVDYVVKDNNSLENHVNLYIENYINSRTKNNQSQYLPQGYLPYDRIGNRLIFNSYRGKVTILYKGVLLDEDGLPYVNYKEKDAIAKYIAYVEHRKRFLMTGSPISAQIYPVLKNEWTVSRNAARVPIYINQNEVNELLDAMTSYDRKQYGISFKVNTSR